MKLTVEKRGLFKGPVRKFDNSVYLFSFRFSKKGPKKIDYILFQGYINYTYKYFMHRVIILCY